MPRLFLGNFDFEHELADSSWRTPPSVRHLLAERAAAWLAIADDRDWIWTPEPIDDSCWCELAATGLPRVRSCLDVTDALARGMELIPWGWSPSVARRAIHRTHPSLETTRVGNSRRWSFAQEQRRRIALPGACRLEQIEDVAKSVQAAAATWGESANDFAWVIKADFGMSGRERLLGRGLQLTHSQQNWLQRRLALDRAAFFEPWLRLTAEVGIQWDIPQQAAQPPRLVGLTPLRSDPQGQYRGSLVTLESSIPPQWQSAVEQTQFIAEQLQALGYFGPLGIDAAIAQDAAGRLVLRPVQDVNARYTMGRLALGFRRFLQPGETAEWQHLAILTEEAAASPLAEANTRVIVTSPARVGQQPSQHRSRLVIRWQ